MYNNLNPKYKSFLFFLIKLTIVVGSLYFIYNKIAHNSELNFSEFYNQIKPILLNNNSTIFILFLFTFFNWFFEIWKWKILVATIQKIRFYDATKQSLAALTVSLLTPNRIGDYGGKAAYFSKNRSEILLLNLIGNLNQLLITILFGIIGLTFFLRTYDIEINLYRLRGIGYLLGFLILLIIPNRNRSVKLFEYLKLDQLKVFLKEITTKTHLNILTLSLVRYILFSHQFYFLLTIFRIETDYLTLIYLIFSMYLIASIIPSISLFDWAVKGSVAIYIFTFIDIPEITIVTITLLMWILNFAIPSIIGSFFVINFKLSKK